jgi:hypothetical protein
VIALLTAAAQASGTCGLQVDGAPAAALDCVVGGEWKLVCDLPSAGPRVRVRASVEGLGLTGEARVPFLVERPDGGASFTLPLSGEGPGAFTAERLAGGLAAGMTLGPSQWCPAGLPGPEGERQATPLVLEVVSYEQTGTVDEILDGGVVNHVATFDRGTPVASVTIPIVQRPASAAADPAPPPADRPLRARLQLRAGDGTWVAVEVTGVRRDVRVPPGAVRLLVVDVPLAQLAALSPDDPVKYLRDDLETWFGGDPSSMLGLVAWSKGDLPAPVPLVWTGNTARTERVDLRLTKGATVVRVVLGWREQGMDAAARKVVDEVVATTP